MACHTGRSSLALGRAAWLCLRQPCAQQLFEVGGDLLVLILAAVPNKRYLLLTGPLVEPELGEEGPHRAMEPRGLCFRRLEHEGGTVDEGNAGDRVK